MVVIPDHEYDRVNRSTKGRVSIKKELDEMDVSTGLCTVLFCTGERCIWVGSRELRITQQMFCVHCLYQKFDRRMKRRKGAKAAWNDNTCYGPPARKKT